MSAHRHFTIRDGRHTCTRCGLDVTGRTDTATRDNKIAHGYPGGALCSTEGEAP